ncbi:hypothetical protein M758_12G134500 [Ceratodon purpureus]|uniref:Uncharacterized protein n=1 Tax=Ceratodon purpureus TaxID=3225 RepID=A0A8T0G9B1_CERPU|nr:hypothetical protein KC19_12G131700 [Ceratodon purpureus]KAG0599188.1 hypothetical protein M758_12G134500 [Ceratodon purpureus]
MARRGGGDPKWVALRMGSLTSRSPVRVADARDHHKHLGYVAILGIAAGMLALICFYLCVWLVRQSRSRQRGPRPDGLEREGVRDEEEKVKRSGEGEGEKPTWNVSEVELVLMAGEKLPTFLAHPVLQCPPVHVATSRV